MAPNTLLKVDNTLHKIELVQLNFDSRLLPKVENEPKRMQQPKYQDFANRLNELMKTQGSSVSTITQLKDTIGVTYEMARRYTLGTAKPREEKMKALADTLNVSISYLDHGIINDGHTSSLVNSLPRSKSLEELVQYLERLEQNHILTENKIKLFQQIIEVIVKN